MGNKIEHEKKRLLQYQPQWTMEDVKRMELPRPQSATQRLTGFVKGMMKRGRAAVSRVIPLPHI